MAEIERVEASELISPIFKAVALYKEGEEPVFEYFHKINGKKNILKQVVHKKGIFVPSLDAPPFYFDEKEEIERYNMSMAQAEFKIQENNKLLAPDNLEGLKTKVESLIYQSNPNWSEITELIKNYLVNKERIFTTRSDDNPEMWIYKEGVYIPEGKTHIIEVCKDVLGGLLTPQRCNNIIFKVQANTYIDQDDFFENKYVDLVPVKNGILNIMTKELEPFDPDKVFFNKLDFEFDPHNRCISIMKHFEKVLKKEDIPLMQEIFGYLLYKDYKFEKAFMFTGGGRNGKGKTVELMKHFIGPNNCCNVTLQQIEKDKFALATFQGKMANLGADISSTALQETGNFKSLTGHDLISANRKNKTYLNFVNYAKMIFCANEIPRSRDLTTAFFNRWIVIDFNKTFVSKEEFEKLESENKTNYEIADPELINKLSCEKELSGLLNWALEGLERLFEEKNFSYSKTTEETKYYWIRKTDSVMAFVEDMCDFDYESSLTKESFKNAYKKYCAKHKIRVFSDTAVKKILENTYDLWSETQRFGDKTFKVWKGVTFK